MAAQRGAGALCVLLASCGRVGFEAVELDAGAILPARFSTPVRVPELMSDAFDDDPTLTADQLEIFFASTRISGVEGLGDIMVSTRGAIGDAWGAPVVIAEINTAGNEESPGISPDGLTMWFSRTIAANPDIYVTTRATRTSAWTTPVLVDELNSVDLDLSPEPARSMLRIAFYRETPRVIYEASRSMPTAAWSDVRRISELSAPNFGHKSPFFFSDRELWYTRDNSGTYDIHRALRPSVDEPFGAEELIEGVNLPNQNDDDPWLSPDGMTLYMESTRAGLQQIFVAQRLLD